MSQYYTCKGDLIGVKKKYMTNKQNLYSTQQNNFPYDCMLGGKLSLATWLNRGERRFFNR